MKQFFKYVFASMLGMILTGVLFAFFGLLIVVGVISSLEGDSEITIKPQSVLHLHLSGMLEERAVDNPLGKYMGTVVNTIGLEEVLNVIKNAKTDPNIAGIYLDLDLFDAAHASIQEIRQELIDFKTAGKFVIAYGDFYSQKQYYLASVATKMVLNPKGMVEWRGLAAQPLFYKDLLANVGIEMQVFKVGTFKSAVEPYIETKMSDANREQVSVLLQSTWSSILDEIALSRKLSTTQLNQLADEMIMLQPATKTVSTGLIDTLLYKTEMRDYLKKIVGLDSKEDLAIVTYDEMRTNIKTGPKDKSGDIVAVYYAFGAIDDSPTSGIISKEVIKDLRKLRENEDVKAVVLRINSPGGSAFGSEQIWREVNELKKTKPVVVSMGDYAASGGYYIACAANYIIAQPTTLTGSIGIFGLIPNLEKLTNKIGVNVDVVKTNKYADFFALQRKMSTEEQLLMQTNVNAGYELFITRCAEGRGVDKSKIESVAQGRVWTGINAKANGLVDELGDLDAAIKKASQLAKLGGYTTLSYPAQKTFFETLFEETPAGFVEAEVLKSELGALYQNYKQIKEFKHVDMLQTRIPYELNFK